MRRPYGVISTADMSREVWLEARRSGIGGSDAAAIAGLSRYASPMSVWLDKTGRVQNRAVGEAAEWGNILEPVVAEQWAARTGRTIRRRKVMLRSIEWPWMLANVDRWVSPGGDDDRESILEIKTGGSFRAKEWADDAIPDEYAVQGMHYLAVTGLHRVHFAALIGGQKFATPQLDRDEDAIAALVKLEREFWQLVLADTPPAIDGRDETADYLLALYPDGDPSKQVVLPPDLFTRYDEAKATSDAAEERLTLVKNEMRALIGDAVRGVSGDRMARWTPATTQRFDAETFKREHADLHSRYVKPSTTRRLTIS